MPLKVFYSNQFNFLIDLIILLTNQVGVARESGPHHYFASSSASLRAGLPVSVSGILSIFRYSLG